VLPAAPRAEVLDVLRISAIPDENPNELLRICTPFAEYLQKELGMKVQFTPVVLGQRIYVTISLF
jgi:ABC-type phosphate/phosphonate transport system substrate-binding protein